MEALALVLIWTCGAIIVYASDGWFEWSGDEETTKIYSALWPFTIWFLFAFLLRRFLRKLKKKSRDKYS